MSQDKMREEFEACARKRGMDLSYRNIPGVGQFYECPRTILALEYWQASRMELAIKLPPKSQPTSDKESEIAWHNVRNSTIDACVRAVEAAGVRVEVGE